MHFKSSINWFDNSPAPATCKASDENQGLFCLFFYFFSYLTSNCCKYYKMIGVFGSSSIALSKVRLLE